jgi:hypothetical protein
MHSTYLLSAALLTLSYLYVLGREKRFREAVLAGLWGLVLVAPVLLYDFATFAPSSPEAFAESQHLLAHVRIPHHAEVGRWLDGIAWAQIGWIILATVLVRGRRLFPIMFLTFILSLLLTLIQFGTGNDTLALLFPWRSSAVLVPIATSVIITRVVNGLADRLGAPPPRRRGVVRAVYGSILAVLVAWGAAISYLGLGYRTNEQEVELLKFVRANKSPGDLYLLPVEVPKLSSERGAVSLNFTPPPRRDSQSQTISVDLQSFRLSTGAPIYVDFKSVPYKDVEVLEWHRRLLWNQGLYEHRDWNDEGVKAELARRHITHVVATTDRDVHCDALELVHEDASYRVYRFRGPEVTGRPGE